MAADKSLNILLETGTLSGGVRVVGEIANRLTARGWSVTVWSVNPRESMGWFRLDGRVKWQSFRKTGQIADYEEMCAVLARVPGRKMATYWRTAAMADKFKAIAPGEGFYLVQDYETTYAYVPGQVPDIEATYHQGLKLLATSRYVMSRLPEAEYIGIGLSAEYHPDAKQRRLPVALAALRRQHFKGYSTMMEVIRYLDDKGIHVTTFGLDKRRPSVFVKQSDEHVIAPDDNKVRALYRTRGCFISTSLHEGFNLTALEAMACGCPVVKTHDDGSNEYSDDGANCLVSDSPFELADLVERVMKDHALAERLSDAGVETAKRYVWKDVIDRLEVALT